MVYCVTVPYNKLFIRRNGKGVWCGNSLRLSLDNSDTFIDDIIFEYQRLSYYICEYCGSTENVGRTEQKWIFTICDKCFFKDDHFSKFIWKQNKKQYKDFISELKNTKDK